MKIEKDKALFSYYVNKMKECRKVNDMEKYEHYFNKSQKTLNKIIKKQNNNKR